MFKNILLATALLVSAATASADVFKFSWGAVEDSRVASYVLAWGKKSVTNGGVYGVGSVEVPVGTTTATSPDMEIGTYYFAVKACNADKTLCSDWSNEVVASAAGPISVPPGLKLDSMTFSIK
jgi:hypothetical protein